jgi:histidine ammonia-lyase
VKNGLALVAATAAAFLLVSMELATAKPVTASQRRAFACNYQAAERSYEGPAMAAYVRRCLKRHHPALIPSAASSRKR